MNAGPCVGRVTASVLALFVATLLLGGCKRLPPPPPPPSNEVSQSTAESSQLPPVDLYVDDSVSMQGFVNLRDSKYKRVAAMTFEKIITAGYPYSVIRLSDLFRARPSDAVTSAQLLSERFYRGGQTPLATLLDKVTERARGERLVVLVSDLVQSEKARPHHQFIEAFRRAAAARSDVLLLGFRSAFRGTYFVETEPKDYDAFPVDLDGTSAARSRPFYLLVLAPSDRSLLQFRKYVIDHLAPEEEFYASEPPIAVTKLEFVPEGAFGSFLPIESLANRRGGFVGTFIERRVPQKGKGDLRLRLTAVRKLPILSLDDFRYEISRRGRKADEWMAVQVPVAANWGFSTKPATSSPSLLSFVLAYQFSRVPPYSWETYRMRMRAGRANVVPPPWVAQWSTRDDRYPEQGNRTLNLALAVEAMIRAITEEVILTEHYIRLARES